MRSPFGGDDDDNATVHNNNGNDDARGGIARRNSTAYAGAESAGSWQDNGDRTRRWMTAMCLLDCMGVDDKDAVLLPPWD